MLVWTKCWRLKGQVGICQGVGEGWLKGRACAKSWTGPAEHWGDWGCLKLRP